MRLRARARTQPRMKEGTCALAHCARWRVRYACAYGCLRTYACIDVHVRGLRMRDVRDVRDVHEREHVALVYGQSRIRSHAYARAIHVGLMLDA